MHVSDTALLVAAGPRGMYLGAATVEALVSEPLSTGIRRWLIDLATPAMVKRVGMSSLHSLDHVRAADCLGRCLRPHPGVAP